MHLRRKEPCVSELVEKHGTDTRTSCETCGKIFRHTSSLTRHKRSCSTKHEAQQQNERRTPHISIVNNNIVNNNITINAFGREDLSTVTTDLLDACLKRTDKGLIDLVRRIRFDTTGNQNVRADVSHPNLVEFHDGRSWQFATQKTILKTLVDQGHTLMQEHFDDNEDRLNRDWSRSMFNFVCSWLRKMEKQNHRMYEDVMAEVYVLILNRSKDVNVT